ncbi:MAG: endonuclease/exonuclease/phosphatase family protein [Frankiales bacterium]|nr:endonuclease/exonuclease/phosphatase family protein [Frankiales bacterium]
MVLNAGGTYLRDKDDAVRWVSDLLSQADGRPDIACIQEVPSDAWLAAWEKEGYRCILGETRGFKVRSAILTVLPEDRLTRLTAADASELPYHGEYVAAARLRNPDGSSITLMSVHASPRPTTDEYLAHHPDRTRLLPRVGNDAKFGGMLFDSDVVLDTVGQHAPVVACGDLNEARGWDELPGKEGQTWGTEFFGSTADGGRVGEHGLLDVPLSDDGREVVTRRKEGHPALQLDHILVSKDLRANVRNAHVDPAWTAANGEVVGLADHAPLWFELVV